MSIDVNGALDDIRLFYVCELIHQIHFGNQTNFAAIDFCKSDTVALISFKAIPITERASEAPLRPVRIVHIPGRKLFQIKGAALAGGY